MTYSWSTNGENYTGEFETRELALAHARENNPEHKELFTGENHKKSASDFVNVSNYLEDMQVAADDVCGEASEDWLPSWKDQLDKQEELAAIIAKFVDETWPVRFWLVENQVKHDLEAGIATTL